MYDVSGPMRIVIANHSNHSQITDFKRDLWIVSPRENAPHDTPSYHIEIDNSYPHVEGKSYSRLTRVVYLAGERRVVLTDKEYAEQLDAVMEHEIKVPVGMSYQEAMGFWQLSDDEHCGEHGVRSLTEEEAMDYLAARGMYSESEARIDRIQVKVFDALERAWEAVNEFADFAITL